MEKEYWFSLDRSKRFGLVPQNAKGLALIVGFPILALATFDFADKFLPMIVGGVGSTAILAVLFVVIMAIKTDRS